MDKIMSKMKPNITLSPHPLPHCLRPRDSDVTLLQSLLS